MERSNTEAAQREARKDSIASFLGSGKKLFCNICRVQLLPDKSCGICGVYYTEPSALKEVKIKGLDGKTPESKTSDGNEQLLSATVPEPWAKPKDQKMSPLFEGLKHQGFKFTSYTDTST